MTVQSRSRPACVSRDAALSIEHGARSTQRSAGVWWNRQDRHLSNPFGHVETPPLGFGHLYQAGPGPAGPCRLRSAEGLWTLGALSSHARVEASGALLPCTLTTLAKLLIAASAIWSRSITISNILRCVRFRLFHPPPPHFTILSFFPLLNPFSNLILVDTSEQPNKPASSSPSPSPFESSPNPPSTTHPRHRTSQTPIGKSSRYINLTSYLDGFPFKTKKNGDRPSRLIPSTITRPPQCSPVRISLGVAGVDVIPLAASVQNAEYGSPLCSSLLSACLLESNIPLSDVQLPQSTQQTLSIRAHATAQPADGVADDVI